MTNVEVKPRWPWNGKVDITYSIECDEIDENLNPKTVYVAFMGYDHYAKKEFLPWTITGDGIDNNIKTGGPYTVVWDVGNDYPGLRSSAFSVRIQAQSKPLPYWVFNLENGRNTHQIQPPSLDDDACRTTQLWLRHVPAGPFRMGSPKDELGRYDGEWSCHIVTITKDYYIAIFEMTIKQWQMITGSYLLTFNTTEDGVWTLLYAKENDCFPLTEVDYQLLRGENKGLGWPIQGHDVDDDSFFGVLRRKTNELFDLPTEAEWEYACRAETLTALNSGKNLFSLMTDSNMDEVGRYNGNRNDGKGGSFGILGCARVGSYLPNSWGIYDMHGNISEWCLDRVSSVEERESAIEPTTDPVGPKSGTERIVRSGGGYGSSYARDCRSSSWSSFPEKQKYYTSNYRCGFRVVCHPAEK